MASPNFGEEDVVGTRRGVVAGGQRIWEVRRWSAGAWRSEGAVGWGVGAWRVLRAWFAGGRVSGVGAERRGGLDGGGRKAGAWRGLGAVVAGGQGLRGAGEWSARTRRSAGGGCGVRVFCAMDLVPIAKTSPK